MKMDWRIFCVSMWFYERTFVLMECIDSLSAWIFVWIRSTLCFDLFDKLIWMEKKQNIDKLNVHITQFNRVFYSIMSHLWTRLKFTSPIKLVSMLEGQFLSQQQRLIQRNQIPTILGFWRKNYIHGMYFAWNYKDLLKINRFYLYKFETVMKSGIFHLQCAACVGMWRRLCLLSAICSFSRSVMK